MKTLYITLTLLTICSISAFAQGPPPATPIDGGLSLLLAVGGVYGWKRLNDRKSSS